MLSRKLASRALSSQSLICSYQNLITFKG